MTEKEISKALDDEDWYVRYQAIQHPNATPENISKALDDKVWSVCDESIRHPNATPWNFLKALRDPNIKKSAINALRNKPDIGDWEVLKLLYVE